MNKKRLLAIVKQEYFVTIRSVETIFDIFVIPLLTVVVFGFLSLYLAQSADEGVARSIVVGMLFWQVMFNVQYSVTVPSLWNIWSRNLSMMFVSPISLKDYLGAHILTAAVKGLVFFAIGAWLGWQFFGLEIWEMGLVPLGAVLLNIFFVCLCTGVGFVGFYFSVWSQNSSYCLGICICFAAALCCALSIGVVARAIANSGSTFSFNLCF
jgi:hypothetical protein